MGQKVPNAWGLYDMSGNVRGWCQDRHESYSSSAVTDPTGPLTGESRVYRGGYWVNIARLCGRPIATGSVPRAAATVSAC